MNALQFYIRRDRAGFSKKNYPCYELCLDDGTFVMLGKRMKMELPVKYLLTLEDRLIDKLSPGYVGKLRSNEIGNEYELLTKEVSSSSSTGSTKREYASIIYQGLIKEGVSRNVNVAVPRLLSEDRSYTWRSTNVALRITIERTTPDASLQSGRRRQHDLLSQQAA